MTEQNVEGKEIRKKMRKRRSNMRKRRRKNICMILILILCLIFGTLIWGKNTKNGEVVSVRSGVFFSKVIRKIEIKASDRWIELPFTYVGSAKTSGEDWGVYKKTDGDIVYTTEGYEFFDSAEDYEDRFRRLWKLYDEDFTFSSDEEGKMYISVHGRKLKWLQYNPGRRTAFLGGFANRIGVDWDMELEENTVFIYEFPFFRGKGLAEMTLGYFLDEEGRPYWASGNERKYIE